MPIQPINTIKKWFKTGLKPTQNQFWDTWDSFRHKYEQVPIKDIEDLETTLSTKAEKSQLEEHKTDVNAHSQLFSKKEDKANKGVANGYVPLDEVAKIASKYLDIINDLISGGSNSLLSAEQGKILQNQINGIHALLQSDNVNLDTLQEIVDAIEEVQMSLKTILVNDLTTGGVTKALTAEMGKKLNEIKASLASPAFTGVPTAPTAVAGTKTTQIATTEFVKNALENLPTDGVISVTGTGINNIDPKNPIIQTASSTQAGVIDTTSLQSLGGVDKVINDVRIGKGEGTASNNTVVGFDTLSFNTSGDNNTSIGNSSLNKNTVGNNNTAVGFKALNNNSSGNNNTSVGYFTQGNITTGSNNTSIGHTSLSKSTSGSGNTSAGYATLTNNTTGANNTAVGFKALSANTTGFENTSIGLNSGSRITTGRDNTSIGTDSLGNRSNTATAVTGNYNIAVGSFAGSDITSGANNILIENGNTSGSGAITTGSNNIIVNGKNTTGITTGSNNTIIGGYNGSFNPTDNNLVVLGSGSGVVAIRKEADNRLLAPTLTNALIDSGGNKSLITKEYLDAHSSGGGSGNYVVTDNETGIPQEIQGELKIDGNVTLGQGNEVGAQPALLIHSNALSMPAIEMTTWSGVPVFSVLGSGNLRARSIDTDAICTQQIYIENTPVNPNDGVNKAYVDSMISGGGGIPINLQTVTDSGSSTTNSVNIEGVGIGNSSLSMFEIKPDLIRSRINPLTISGDTGLELRYNPNVRGRIKVYTDEYNEFRDAIDSGYSKVKGADGTEPDDFVTKRQLDASSGSSSGTNGTVVANVIYGPHDVSSPYPDPFIFLNYTVGNEDENLIIMFQCYGSGASPSNAGINFLGTYWNGIGAYQNFEADMGALNVAKTLSGRFKKNTKISLQIPPAASISAVTFSCSILKLPNL